MPPRKAVLPSLFASLELKETLTSIDAVPRHPEIAQQILEAEADWRLAPKANKKASQDKVSAHYRNLSGQDKRLPKSTPPAKPVHPPEIAPFSGLTGVRY
jgi:hypothetical protein